MIEAIILAGCCLPVVGVVTLFISMIVDDADKKLSKRRQAKAKRKRRIKEQHKAARRWR